MKVLAWHYGSGKINEVQISAAPQCQVPHPRGMSVALSSYSKEGTGSPEKLRKGPRITQITLKAAWLHGQDPHVIKVLFLGTGHGSDSEELFLNIQDLCPRPRIHIKSP